MLRSRISSTAASTAKPRKPLAVPSFAVIILNADAVAFQHLTFERTSHMPFCREPADSTLSDAAVHAALS
jgi:hypothetical protein